LCGSGLGWNRTIIAGFGNLYTIRCTTRPDIATTTPAEAQVAVEAGQK
jgi:hypothetical protein